MPMTGNPCQCSTFDMQSLSPIALPLPTTPCLACIKPLPLQVSWLHTHVTLLILISS